MGKEVRKVIPKTVQIAVCSSQYSRYLYALDDDGNIWRLGETGWTKIESLPEIVIP